MTNRRTWLPGRDWRISEIGGRALDLVLGCEDQIGVTGRRQPEARRALSVANHHLRDGGTRSKRNNGNHCRFGEDRLPDRSNEYACGRSMCGIADPSLSGRSDLVRVSSAEALLNFR